MAEAKRTRRSKSDVLQSKLDKALSDKEKYTQKLAALDEEIQSLHQQLEESKVGLLTDALGTYHLSVDEALAALAKAGEEKAADSAENQSSQSEQSDHAE